MAARDPRPQQGSTSLAPLSTKTTLISKEAALALVSGKTSKLGGVDPAIWFKGDAPDALYLLGRIPLQAFIPNEAGARYDGTVEEGRARAYGSLVSQAPPILATFGRADLILRVLDGGHRITAERMKGAGTISAIIRLKPGKLEELLLPKGQDALNSLGWGIDTRSENTHVIDALGAYWTHAQPPGPDRHSATSGIARTNDARDDLPMKIVIANFESRSFSFDAFGRDEAEARKSFNRGLIEHKRQLGSAVQDSWLAEAKEGVEFREVELGACYRDREPLTKPKLQATQEAGPSR